jgi:hypothetical protein
VLSKLETFEQKRSEDQKQLEERMEAVETENVDLKERVGSLETEKIDLQRQVEEVRTSSECRMRWHITHCSQKAQWGAGIQSQSISGSVPGFRCNLGKEVTKEVTKEVSKEVTTQVSKANKALESKVNKILEPLVVDLVQQKPDN